MKHIRTMTVSKGSEHPVSGPVEAQRAGKFGIGTSLVSTATFLLAKVEIVSALTSLGGGDSEG